MGNVDKIGVHISHCCVLHGCKYRDEDCVVATGKMEQTYICEECSDYGIYSIQDMKFIQSLHCCDDLINLVKHIEDLKSIKKFKVCPFCETRITIC